jgi:purine-binding chemotaxis protein CheW
VPATSADNEQTGDRRSAQPDEVASVGAVSFVAAGASLAIPLGLVRQIVDVPLLVGTAGRGAVRGTIDVQGVAVPLLDLGMKLGADETPVGPLSAALVVDGALPDTHVALLVGAMGELVELAPDELAPPPLFVDRSAAPLLGIAKLPHGIVPVLDVERLLSAEERVDLAALAKGMSA